MDLPTQGGAGQPARHRVGTSIGPYSLLRVIGQGAMATVFEAEHTLIGRNVAIKVLHEDAEENPTAVARFFQEAQAINRLHHPSIIEITDVAEGSDDHAPYMVMELLEGVSLDRLISSRQIMTPARVADIGHQICDAMEAVHSAGIVHRDLKPENVLVTGSGSPKLRARHETSRSMIAAETPAGRGARRANTAAYSTDEQRSPAGWIGGEGEQGVSCRALRAKLLDFGVAKFLAAEENALHTRTGAIVGTPEYMAPEQVRGQAVDTRTDIYALGCILFEMLTGTRPFQAPQLGELLRLQLQHSPPRPSMAAGEDGGGDISKHFDDLVLACLEKDPARRPSSMAEVADRLLQVMDARDTALIRVQPADRDVARPTGPRIRRWPPWAIAASALFTVVGGFALWLASGPGRPRAVTPAPTPSVSAPEGQDAAVTARSVSPPPHPRRPGGSGLTLVSSPNGAAVYDALDGRFLGRTPLSLDRPASGRPLLFRAAGHQDRGIVLHPDAPEVMAIELPKEGPAPPRSIISRPHRPELRPPHAMPPEPMPREPIPGEWGTVDPFAPMVRP